MKILLADDHPLVRSGLRLLLMRLQPDARIVEASDYPEALQACRVHSDFTLVLLDRIMPGMDGCGGLASLKEQIPDTPIVILSASEDASHVWESLENGARGYIPKSSTEDVMQSALHLILSGGTYLPPVLLQQPRARKILNTKANRRIDESKNVSGNYSELTQRQLEVLQLMATGKSNKEIARQLAISAATVSTHLNTIFRILNVNNRTEAVHAATNSGVPLKP